MGLRQKTISYFSEKFFPRFYFDLSIIVPIFLLTSFGILMLYSSSYIFAQERFGSGFYFLQKQIIFLMLSMLIFLTTARIPFEKWMKWSYPILLLTVLFLALVFVPGVGIKIKGASRWIHLGFFNFQPAELAKFSVILFACRQLYYKREFLHRFKTGVLSLVLAPLPVFLLLIFQPDFGTLVILTFTMLLLMFSGGVSIKHFFYSSLVIVLGGIGLVFAEPYRVKRLMSYLNPWEDPGGTGFQMIQSLVAFQNGGIFGMGLGNGKEKLFYLPEAHNDFIFSVIAEELGFLGVTVIAVTFLFIIFRGMKVATKCLKNDKLYFGYLLGLGITYLIGVQVVINFCVTLGLLPTKGLALPFVSYGGSSLLMNFFLLGILLNISNTVSQNEN